MSTTFTDILSQGFDAAVFLGWRSQDRISSDQPSIYTKHSYETVHMWPGGLLVLVFFGTMLIVHLLTFLGPIKWKYFFRSLLWPLCQTLHCFHTFHSYELLHFNYTFLSWLRHHYTWLNKSENDVWLFKYCNTADLQILQSVCVCEIIWW